MTAQRLLVTGHVQGVGYRDWAVAEARRLGVSGWVRNLRDGRVEILAQGSIDPLEAFISACWRGPASAHVVSVLRENAVVAGEPPAGFVRRSTE